MEQGKEDAFAIALTYAERGIGVLGLPSEIRGQLTDTQLKVINDMITPGRKPPAWSSFETVKPIKGVKLLHLNRIRPQHHRDVQRMYAILWEHSCEITNIVPEKAEPYTQVLFPEGTTSQQLYPQTTETRYRVMLPDGLELQLVDSQGKYTLAIVIN